MKHKIKNSIKLSVIVFTDYSASIAIIKQISLSLLNINKLNLCLICALQYLSAFFLNIYHKSEKQDIVLNILLHLFRKYNTDTEEDNKLIFHIILIKMSDDF